eukprot:Gregarina_sp_Pseudo_9__1181@NODE_1778_length_1335_cov_300_196759_g1647_i0_p1_GENE_NODE_1778_length_1335_cov_300_196759_g1647_i0NODE_1778_length_1335_cov_300_196759_g1647_i0_p1_ORF_typecomplete_len122_score27_79C2/PF00168_30/3e17B9C2/PF07162_11/0_0089_NODE_1778_length_1335_cov_300_196759_g1647_i0615980
MTFLRVIVESASGMPKKKGLLDKLDPYVVCQVGPESEKTSVKKNAGSNAEFNETLHLNFNGEPHLMIHVMDHDKIGKDDLVGSGRLELTSHILGCGWNGRVPIANAKGISAGEVTLQVARC